tara:strand:- start:11 stop:733 length:723 start_codon:yes stop_codon:yes gene_type:complete
MTNPKIRNTNMITARPQGDDCPLECSECFYNSDNYYEDKSTASMPSVEESKEKIVKVNDGHDSNIDSDRVISTTSRYKDKFYNTSIGTLFFKKPTILTINGKDTDETYIETRDIRGDLNTLMAIRFRVNLWNIGLCEDAINTYRGDGIGAPFLLTDMRYNNIASIPKEFRKWYEYKEHISNSYYSLNKKGLDILFTYLMRYFNVYWCGNPFTKSTLCEDCFLCEHFYIVCKSKINWVKKG